MQASVIEEVRREIREGLRQALQEAVAAGEIQITEGETPPLILEPPREKAHGDWASNLAMLLARPARRPPRELAAVLARRFRLEGTFVAKVEVAGPGFLNFYLHRNWLAAVARSILTADTAYGQSQVGGGERVLLEFVSANPTGPLHVGHGRGAAVGSALARILRAAGYAVTCEFYINDAGNQIDKFGLSLEVRYRQALGEEVALPEDGYHGEDLREMMAELAAQEGARYLELPEGERRAALVAYALPRKLAAIREDLAAFGVEFDSWFAESTLHEEGAIQRAVERLRAGGHLYEEGGALWLRATAFGDDKDRVVVRENGVPTYLAADIAYHEEKFRRGFSTLINVWGADHHGYIARVRAALAALGHDPQRLEVLLVQMVNLFRNGEAVVMSKRAGQLVTLKEIIEEVGRDAARFFFLLRSADAQLDFDLDLARCRSNENPVYYVQYAHARISSLLRQAAAQGLEPESLAGETDLSVLREEVEEDLLRKLAFFPLEVAEAATRREPHRLTYYAQDLAALFHLFYTRCRVLGAEPPLEAARLLLCAATRVVLRNVLTLLGVSAPEQM